MVQIGVSEEAWLPGDSSTVVPILPNIESPVDLRDSNLLMRRMRGMMKPLPHILLLQTYG